MPQQTSLGSTLPLPLPLAHLSRVIRYEGSSHFRAEGPTEDWDIHHLEAGSVCVDVGGTTHVVPAGGIIIRPPGSQLSIEIRSSVTLYHCHFVSSILAVAETGQALLLPLCRALDVPLHRRVLAIWETIRLHQERSGGHAALLAKVSLLHLLLLLADAALPGPNETFDGVGAKPPRRHVDRALAVIGRDYARSLTPATVAAAVGVNAEYLNRLFQRFLGRSLGQSILSHRLAVARELLLGTDLPVKQIAGSCGFRDPLYFSRIFRAAEGQSPSAYRQ